MTNEEIIYDVINSDAVAAWLTAEHGEYLGVYADGKYGVGQDIGKEIAEDEQPIAIVRCPGIGNIEEEYWTVDWIVEQNEEGKYIDKEGKEYTLAECVQECCDHGDVSPFIEELRDALIEDLED